MNRLLVGVLSLTLVLVAPLTAQQKTTTPPKPAAAQKPKPGGCKLSLDSAGTAVSNTMVGPTGKNAGSIMNLGDHAGLSCIGKGTHLQSDSMISYNDYDVVTAINHVIYRDDKYDITADTVTRNNLPERIIARGNVHITDRKTGSTLVGPKVDYLRANPATKDTDVVIAVDRPTATIYPDGTAKEKVKPTPYLLKADRILGWGSDKVNAYGTVTLERDSLRATGDSLNYVTGKSKAAKVFGAPGRLERFGANAIHMQGKIILMGFADDNKLKDVRASGNGLLLRDAAAVTADTVLVGLKGDQLTSVLAWDHSKRAHLEREGYDAYADSLAVDDSKANTLSELRLFTRAIVYQPIDTATTVNPMDSLSAKDRDWLSGEHVVVSFRQVDSSGTTLTMVDRLLANHASTKVPSCSFFSNRGTPATSKSSTTKAPTISYSCADVITVRMKTGLLREVEGVKLRGNVNGLQLEQATPANAPPTVPPVKRP